MKKRILTAAAVFAALLLCAAGGKDTAEEKPAQLPEGNTGLAAKYPGDTNAAAKQV